MAIPGRLAGAVVAELLIVAVALGEVSTHIPAAPDPATTSLPIGPSYQISIGPLVKIPIRMPLLLQLACRAGGKNISACTLFAEEKLDCRCSRIDQGWQLEASVSFVPVMYLISDRWVSHEQSHIDDVIAMLRDHLDGLVRLRFESQESCSLVAARQSSRFTDLMNEFRRQSNRRLH